MKIKTNDVVLLGSGLAKRLYAGGIQVGIKLSLVGLESRGNAHQRSRQQSAH
jgi:hypothetical protein